MPVQFVNGGYIVWQDNDTPQWLMLCERSLSTDLYSYLLAELIQRILNSANGLVVNEVYVFQNGKCTNFANDSGKQTIRYFRVVPDDQELVCKL